MGHEIHTSWASRYILFFILSFTVGILVSSLIDVEPLVAVFVFILGATALLVEKYYDSHFSRETLTLALLMIAFSSGALRYAIKDFHEAITPSETGTVVSEPEDKDNARKFVFLADNGEKVLVSVPLYTHIEYGDKIKASGKLDTPRVIEGKNGERNFDYGQYLSKDDIYYTLGFAKLEVLSHDNGNPIKALLFRIKRNFVEQGRRILAEPYAGLLMGLIIAGRDALPAEIIEEFRRAGVIHIVVLSGFNITLIAEFLRRAFLRLFLALKWSRYPFAPALASIAGVMLFVVMTGGEATVVRAALMALTVIVAGLFGRTYSASRALLFAGFLMLLENPKILVFDPSFQLSFLATLGLIYVMPAVENVLAKTFLAKWEELLQILAQTLSTQLMVLPLLVYSVGDVSLVSLPANLLILLVVPWTMFVGFVAVLVSYLSVTLAWPITFLAQILLSWILFVSHTLGSLSFATIAVPNISVWAVFLFYIILVALIQWSKYGFPRLALSSPFFYRR